MAEVCTLLGAILVVNDKHLLAGFIKVLYK